MTLESMIKWSQSRLKFMREQFWNKLICHESVNPLTKISLVVFNTQDRKKAGALGEHPF